MFYYNYEKKKIPKVIVRIWSILYGGKDRLKMGKGKGITTTTLVRFLFASSTNRWTFCSLLAAKFHQRVMLFEILDMRSSEQPFIPPFTKINRRPLAHYLLVAIYWLDRRLCPILLLIQIQTKLIVCFVLLTHNSKPTLSFHLIAPRRICWAACSNVCLSTASSTNKHFKINKWKSDFRLLHECKDF